MKKRKTTKFPVGILVVGGFLLIIAVAFLFMQNEPNPAPSQPTAAVIAQGEQATSEIPRVSLKDAKAALDANTAVFVDVRGDTVYTQSHIPGALSIPLTDLENHLDELNPADWIITYCT